MNVFTTHGAFSWCELNTPDPEAALRFYGELLGWTHQTSPMPMGNYHVVKVGDTSVGGIMAPPPGSPPMPAAWGAYVTVDDVDACAKRAVELGGKLVYGPADIEEVGRMAVIVDPQGAALSLITYAPPAA
jgi:uncharacterized protein